MKVCSIEGCGLPVLARGWCSTHYARWRRLGTVELPPSPTCVIVGCGLRRHGRGWCITHYSRWRAHGDPTGGARRYDFPESLLRRLRFMPPTTMPTGCIEFTGALNLDGYGALWPDGRLEGAHRASYKLVRGPIPAGLELDHLCVNPPCVNPAHLEPVTHAENVRRAIERQAA